MPLVQRESVVGIKHGGPRSILPEQEDELTGVLWGPVCRRDELFVGLFPCPHGVLIRQLISRGNGLERRARSCECRPESCHGGPGSNQSDVHSHGACLKSQISSRMGSISTRCCG